MHSYIPVRVRGSADPPAHGIIVPLLYTADDAKKLVQSAKFPPVGQRGYGSPFPMEKFGGGQSLGLVDYLKQANDSLLTIVQIETREALQNARCMTRPQLSCIKLMVVGSLTQLPRCLESTFFLWVLST